VAFNSEEAADKAEAAMNRKELDGRKIKVRVAETTTEYEANKVKRKAKREAEMKQLAEDKKTKKAKKAEADAAWKASAAGDKAKPLTATEKKVKALRKLLAQCKVMNEKVANGGTLLPEQQAKLDKEDDLKKQLKKMEKTLKAGGDSEWDEKPSKKFAAKEEDEEKPKKKKKRKADSDDDEEEEKPKFELQKDGSKKKTKKKKKKA
jgi:hypothetical protein